MRKKDCFYLGKIVRKHSFKGDVVLSNNLVPFFIEKSLLQKGNQLRIKFEDIESEDDADAIMGAELYLPLEFLPKLTGNKFYFHEIINFDIEDVNYGPIGVIVGVNDSSAQPLFEINANGKDVFIPMIDDFIKKVDRDNKKIIVETPEGLIDLYLNN
jgi:16S rRNA processing protein RimM